MGGQYFIMIGVSVVCGISFYSIGIFASKIEKPMWFWSGDVIKPYEVKDVKAYNNANSKMWKTYGLLYFISAFISYFNLKLGTVLLIIISTIGILGLIWCYEMIIKKKYMY